MRLKLNQSNISFLVLSVHYAPKQKTIILAHTKWVCKDHTAFTPKYRRKIIYNELKKYIQQTVKDLCKWKGLGIMKRNMMQDYEHT